MTTEDAIWIARDGQKHGPYTEADLLRWLEEGRVAPQTLAWRDGLPDWQPLSVFLRDVQSPGLPDWQPLSVFLRDVQSPGAWPGSLPPSGSTPLLDKAPPLSTTPSRDSAAPVEDARASLPTPPSLHWLVVALFSFCTGGIFGLVWMFVQAGWVKQIDPASKASTWLVVGVVLAVVGGITGAGTAGVGHFVPGFALAFAWAVAFVAAFFSMRKSIQADAKRRGLSVEIGGISLFLFNSLYLQGQMTWLARWKATGETTPAPPKAIFWWLWVAFMGAMSMLALLLVIAFGSRHWH